MPIKTYNKQIKESILNLLNYEFNYEKYFGKCNDIIRVFETKCMIFIVLFLDNFIKLHISLLYVSNFRLG